MCENIVQFQFELQKHIVSLMKTWMILNLYCMFNEFLKTLNGISTTFLIVGNDCYALRMSFYTTRMGKCV